MAMQIWQSVTSAQSSPVFSSKHVDSRQTYRGHETHDDQDLPSAGPHLAPQHGVLLPPEAERAQRDGDHGRENEEGGERGAQDVVAERLVRVHGVLQPQQLRDDDARHGQHDGGAEVAEKGALECCGRLGFRLVRVRWSCGMKRMKKQTVSYACGKCEFQFNRRTRRYGNNGRVGMHGCNTGAYPDDRVSSQSAPQR